jgi:tyrosyl-tRNA synthetase
MSKSYGNYVGINEPPETMFEKLVERFRGSDDVLWSYYTLLTDLSPQEVEAIRHDMAAGAVSPADVRYRLARLVVGDFHGATAAEGAEQAVRARHAARLTGEIHEEASLPAVDVAVGEDGTVGLARVIVDLRFAPSTSEATRQIKAGGVRINGERVMELRWRPDGVGREYMLAVGGKKLARIFVRGDAD